MAIATKTIEYAFNTYNQHIPDNTALSFGTHTIYIPETTDRRFRSCIVEVFFQENATLTNSNLGNKTVSVNLGGTTVSYTDTSTDSSSSENISFLFSYDFTKHFNDSFGTGSSNTVNITITYDYSQANTRTLNASAKIILTYEYETDGITTQIKTVRIPLDSEPNARLTSASTQYIGTIPIISDWLPENNKVIRDYFFTSECNNVNTGAGQQSWAMGFSISGGTPISGSDQRSPLLTALFTRHIFSLTGSNMPDTGSSHNLLMFLTGENLVGSGVQLRCVPLSNILTITYEYDEPSSNRILNSLMYLYDVSSYIPINVIGSGFYLEQNINIQESGINFINSAIRLNFCNQLTNTQLAVGANNYQLENYMLQAGTAVAGGYCLNYRLDSGNIHARPDLLSNWGRGSNLLNVSGYVSGSVGGTLYPQAIHSVIYLNYISDKHPSGSHRHAHTIIDRLNMASGTQTLNTFLRGLSGFRVNDTSPLYINNLALHGINVASSAVPTFIQIYLRNTSTDGTQMGWSPVLTEINHALGEAQTHYVGQNMGNLFKRYEDQPNEGYKLKFNQIREALSYKGYTSKNSLYLYNTYHTMNAIISGNLINYSGDGSGVTVNVMSATENKLLKTITSENNGVFTGLWYDNTTPLYTTAIQNDNYLGRSLTGNALMLS